MMNMNNSSTFGKSLQVAQKQLPFLPGNTFEDSMLKDKHHKRHIFDYKNRLAVVNDLSFPEETQYAEASEASQQLETLRSSNNNSTIEPVQQQDGGSGTLKPKWLSLDRKVLRFFCYFKEAVHESNVENYRVRKCVLYYYLEDDTVHVSEPRQDNSGIPQGSLVKRHRVPKPTQPNMFYNMEDFNVSQEIEIYGKVFRIVDCDKFTRDFLTSCNIQVPAGEEYPPDQYSKLREDVKKNMNPLNILNQEDHHLKRYLEYSFKGRHCNPSKDEQAAIQNFLAKDRQVLRFYCCWDDREAMYGDFRSFVLEYYLADDKIKISENYNSNIGRDPFPVFLKKAKIPKPTASGESTNTAPEYYTEKDFGIGKVISVYSKRFLLYDCDEFTKKYYTEKYGITDFEPISVGSSKQPLSKPQPPPHNGYGTEEDSLGSWKFLVLKPPKKDVKKFMEKDKVSLRFGAIMDTTKPEDVDRKFIVTFYLADDTVAIYEPATRNSGVIGGKFLQRQRVKNAETGQWFTAQDFFVGATVSIFNHKFILTQTDEHTVKYMEARPNEFTLADINHVLRKVRDQMFTRHSKVRQAFLENDNNHYGHMTINDLRDLMNKLNLKLSEQELITIMRFYDQDLDGVITFQEFQKNVMNSASPDIELMSKSMTETSEGGDEKIKQATIEKEKNQFQMEVFKKFKSKVVHRRLLFQDTFRIISDRSSDSLIGEAEFRKATKENFQLSLNDIEMQALVDYVFPPNRKRLTLNDFVKIIEGTSSFKHAK